MQLTLVLSQQLALSCVYGGSSHLEIVSLHQDFSVSEKCYEVSLSFIEQNPQLLHRAEPPVDARQIDF